MTDDLLITTVAEAKAYLREHWHDGVECPCCGQFVKQYRRALYAGMAYSLINLARLNYWNRNYQHMSVIGTPKSGGGDFSKLAYWDLIEPMPGKPDDPSLRTHGMWRITDKGIAFAHNRIRVPAAVYVYNNRVYGRDDKQITIIDALGKKFDYADLMRWAA